MSSMSSRAPRRRNPAGHRALRLLHGAISSTSPLGASWPCRAVSCRGRVAAVSRPCRSGSLHPLPSRSLLSRPLRARGEPLPTSSPAPSSLSAQPPATPPPPTAPRMPSRRHASSSPARAHWGAAPLNAPPPHVSPGDCSGNGDPRRLQFPGSSSKGVSQLVCRGGGGRRRGRAGRAGRARVPPAGAGAPPPAGSPGSRTGAASRACARGRGDAGGGRGRAVG